MEVVGIDAQLCQLVLMLTQGLLQQFHAFGRRDLCVKSCTIHTDPQTIESCADTMFKERAGVLHAVTF